MYKQLTQQITNNTKTKKRGKSLFITGLPRYYRFMLFANYYSSTAACAARKSFSKSARLAMLGKLIANTFQEALILLRLFLDRGLGRSKTLLIFSKFKLIGKLKRNPLNFLEKKTYLQAFLQQLRQQSYYDYQ